MTREPVQETMPWSCGEGIHCRWHERDYDRQFSFFYVDHRFCGLAAVAEDEGGYAERSFSCGRKLGFLLVGGGLLFANINTATIVGENELVYTNNMTVMAWGITSVLAMLVVSEFIMPIYLRTGIATTPDYLSARYDRGTGKLVSVIFLVSYVVNLLPTVLYSGAVAFSGLFHLPDRLGLDYWTTIWIVVWIMGATGCLYSVLGGLKAIAVSDMLLGMGIFAGGVLLPFFRFAVRRPRKYPYGAAYRCWPIIRTT
jgi:uncharacterized sodium:solute symporter family permease YidK